MSLEVLWGRPNKATPIDIHEVRIPIVNLARPLQGLRLAMISDLHYGHYVLDDYAGYVTELVNAESPDVVLLLGDLVNNRPDQIAPCAKALSQLRAPLGVLGCLGNHEYYAGPRTAARTYRDGGIDILINSHRCIAVGDAELVIAGLDDHRLGRPDSRTALEGVDGELPAILMCHNPDHAECLDGSVRVDLMVCGHTHGGQIVLGDRPILTRTRYRRYWRGLVPGPHCRVYTSRGVGVVALPIRVNCRPEIPIFRLEIAE